MIRAVQEAQRAKQREEFRQAKRTKTVAEHPHATKRVRQVSVGYSSLQTVKISVQLLSFENPFPRHVFLWMHYETRLVDFQG